MAHWPSDVRKGFVCGILCWFTLEAGLAAQVQKAARGASAAKTLGVRPSALDKKQFEFYVRHLFVWPPPIAIEIGDPAASAIPGFYAVSVHASQGNASQDEKFFVSKDGRQILRGSVYEIAANPFREQLAKLKTEGHPSVGTAGAPVVLVEFSDFQCHFCREEAKLLREKLIAAYPQEVHLYFMDFPFDVAHPWARAAAIAGRCVYRQSEPAFWLFHDWIFEHQEETTAANLAERIAEWGKEIKDLDAAKLSACMESKTTESEVNASLALGRSLDVSSTPTIFVNGRPLVGATPWEELKRVIDFEAGYQQTAKNAGENCGCDVSLPKSGVK